MTTFLEESKEKLEAVLDEYFPKIEEEGEEKRLNKRGAALMLYSEAVLLLTLQRKQMREKIENCRLTYTADDADYEKNYPWNMQKAHDQTLSDILNALNKE
mgnify:CR=1 FL=1